MTTLEAVSGLLALTMDPDRVRNKSVVLVTDNMAVTLAYKSGHSRDPLFYSVVKAFNVIARALNVKLSEMSDLQTAATHSCQFSLIVISPPTQP